MSTALPFPLPVAAYGAEKSPRDPRYTAKVVVFGIAGIVAMSMVFSALEPKQVHPTLRRVR